MLVCSNHVQIPQSALPEPSGPPSIELPEIAQAPRGLLWETGNTEEAIALGY